MQNIDPYLYNAGIFIAEKQLASIGLLQRVFKINFCRAQEITDQLLDIGLIEIGKGLGRYNVIMNKENFIIAFNAIQSESLKSESNVPKWEQPKNEYEMEVESATIDLKNVIIYFKNGQIIDVSPDVYNYYKSQFYSIDGKIYDSYSIESINNISIPDYTLSKSLGTPVYNLEYLLRMRASQERKKGNNELAYALQYKSMQLMKYSNIDYSKSDFYRLVNWLYEDRKIYEAQALDNWLHKECPYLFIENYYHAESFKRRMSGVEDCDYVFCTPHEGSCPECAKMQCRVYCISGNDKRFPKLPEIVSRVGGFHEGCLHSFYPYFIEAYMPIMDLNQVDHDAIEYSNRPYIDDRSEDDKKLYAEKLVNIEKRKQLEQDRENYYRIISICPDVAPKSFSSFRSLKRNNSPKYKNLKSIAENYGITI